FDTVSYSWYLNGFKTIFSFFRILSFFSGIMLWRMKSMFCLLGLRVDKERIYGSINDPATDRSISADHRNHPDTS
ncbi:MAG: hypothetical protein J5365_05725, partial [Erysipelotrichaceae bacterium]|nr:hypothetical protein [Erysipelotrichaceae bacterium]